MDDRRLVYTGLEWSGSGVMDVQDPARWQNEQMTDAALGPPRRGPSVKGWLVIVALSVAGLVAVLVGVALLAAPGDPCGCSPVPPSPSASASAT
jgi:hypothetical protein